MNTGNTDEASNNRSVMYVGTYNISSIIYKLHNFVNYQTIKYKETKKMIILFY